MLRYLFGAYESLEEPLAVLATPALVFARRQQSGGRTIVWNYYITEKGRDVARAAMATAPRFSTTSSAARWRVSRMKVVRLSTP